MIPTADKHSKQQFQMDDIPALQEQWETQWAKPTEQLRALTSKLISSTRPRVNQLDSHVLDGQVSELLLGRVTRCIQNLKPLFISEDAIEDFLEDWKPELSLALRAALWAVTVGLKGQTYGADLQNISFVQKLSPLMKVVHFGLSVMLPWAWSRADREITFRGWSTSPQQQQQQQQQKEQPGDEPASTNMFSNAKWKYLEWRAMRIIETLTKVSSVVNFLVFLKTGRYPTLVDRAMGMTMQVANPNMRRTVLYGQMHRQLLWEGVSEVAILALPLLASSNIRKLFSRIIAAFSAKVLRKKSHKAVSAAA